MHIYIYIERERFLGWHYLSNATCLIRPHLFSTAFSAALCTNYEEAKY